MMNNPKPTKSISAYVLMPQISLLKGKADVLYEAFAFENERSIRPFPILDINAKARDNGGPGLNEIPGPAVQKHT